MLPRKRWLERMRKICLALPETSERDHFGTPMFFAGKKGFAGIRKTQDRTHVWFKVPADDAHMLLEEPRFEAAPGMSAGWVLLTLEDPVDWDELSEHLLESYRLNALKRMLKALDA